MESAYPAIVPSSKAHGGCPPPIQLGTAMKMAPPVSRSGQQAGPFVHMGEGQSTLAFSTGSFWAAASTSAAFCSAFAPSFSAAALAIRMAGESVAKE